MLPQRSRFCAVPRRRAAIGSFDGREASAQNHPRMLRFACFRAHGAPANVRLASVLRDCARRSSSSASAPASGGAPRLPALKWSHAKTLCDLAMQAQWYLRAFQTASSVFKLVLGMSALYVMYRLAAFARRMLPAHVVDRVADAADAAKSTLTSWAAGAKR